MEKAVLCPFGVPRDLLCKAVWGKGRWVLIPGTGWIADVFIPFPRFPCYPLDAFGLETATSGLR